MNILYYGFNGSASMDVWGYILTILGGICLIIDIILLFIDTEEAKFSIFVGSVLAIVLGVLAFQDTRVPIVKATIDNSVSWAEVQKDYEFLKQEGEIYTFKVKNTTIDEWLLKIDNPS